MSKKTRAMNPKGQLGKLPPRYKFVLNQYDFTRLSKCSICGKPTHRRKFPLFIYIKDWGLLALGKTCRFCSLCELIICHQDELEDELVNFFERASPRTIGNPYIVLGTVDKKVWKDNLETAPESAVQQLEHVADFKKVLRLTFQGGWQPIQKR